MACGHRAPGAAQPPSGTHRCQRRDPRTAGSAPRDQPAVSRARPKQAECGGQSPAIIAARHGSSALLFGQVCWQPLAFDACR
jgi:hypothetical protein